MPILRWHAAIICAFWIAAASAATADPYYAGKRLSVLVNFAPGGSTDINGRLFARYIGRHIEGQPTVVVQNMDGAGGFNGTLHLGEVAPKDGTTLGFLGGTAWQYATEPERFRVDLKRYEFISYLSNTTVYYARTDVPPGLKSATDLVKAQGLVAGGNGPFNGRDLLIRLTLDMLGVPYRYVTGYRSGQTARLALQRNEINFFAEPAPAYRSIVQPSLVEKGEAIAVYDDPRFNGKSFSPSKEAEGLSILPFPSLYKASKGTEPSGPLWDVYLSLLTLNSTLGTVLVLPPGAPDEAGMALRKAVADLNRDDEFAQQAIKLIGYVPQYETDADINSKVRQALSVPPAVKSFVANYVKNTGK